MMHVLVGVSHGGHREIMELTHLDGIVFSCAVELSMVFESEAQKLMRLALSYLRTAASY